MIGRRSSARIGQQLVSGCMDWLELNGYVCIRTQNMRIGHNKIGGIYPIRARDSQRGIPDIIAWKPMDVRKMGSFPMTYFLECKVGSGKLSPEQIGWKEKVESIGAVHAIVKSIEDVMIYFPSRY